MHNAFHATNRINTMASKQQNTVQALLQTKKKHSSHVFLFACLGVYFAVRKNESKKQKRVTE